MERTDRTKPPDAKTDKAKTPAATPSDATSDKTLSDLEKTENIPTESETPDRTVPSPDGAVDETRKAPDDVGPM